MERVIKEVPDLGFKQIYDDFHGLISLTKKEVEIIDTPIFQRLRNIRQLGLAGFIFPGGIHNRFSHSLGVLSILHRLIRQLEYFDDKPDEVEKLRMAALLHDIGHLPLSHTVEAVYEHVEKVDEDAALLGKIVPRKSSKGKSLLEKSERREKVAFHERLGEFVICNTDFPGGITRVLKQEGFKPEEIGSIIVSNHGNPLYNQLINSDMDADQMDYLLRDAKNVGISYGNYEIDYLISCMRCDQIEKPILYLSRKGLNSAEYYLLAKYYYYTQILYHPKREIYEILASVLYQIALEFSLVPTKLELYDRIKRPKFFEAFDDRWFFDKIEKLGKKEIACKRYPWVVKLIGCVRFRKHQDVIKLENEEAKIIKEGDNKAAEEIEQEYNDFITPACLKKSCIKKYVKVQVAKTEESLKKKYESRDSLVKGGHILIEQNGQKRLINSCEGSLIPILAEHRTFFLRTYKLEL